MDGTYLQNLYYDYVDNTIKRVDNDDEVINNSCSTLFKSDIHICNSKNMYDMNTCLTNTINNYNTESYNTSNTRRDNWVSLYNEQYIENIQLGVGILVISIILAKMMFFPIKMKM